MKPAGILTEGGGGKRYHLAGAWQVRFYGGGQGGGVRRGGVSI